MPTTDPARGFVTYVARQIGRSPSAVRKYIKQTQDTPHVLGLEQTDNGLTLDVEKARAYADSRPKGRPSKQTEAGA